MNSKRKCAHCGNRSKAETMFIHGIQAFCNKDHYIEYAASNVSSLAKKGRKIENKRHAERKREFQLNDKRIRKAATRKACHTYIHARDANQPCISCGTFKAAKWDAGHYRPDGKNAALRYDERNIHRQCSQCNQQLSGNLTEYRKRLIEKIGEEAVIELETNNETKKYDCEELLQIEQHYKDKLKALQDKAA